MLPPWGRAADAGAADAQMAAHDRLGDRRDIWGLHDLRAGVVDGVCESGNGGVAAFVGVPGFLQRAVGCFTGLGDLGGLGGGKAGF